MVTKGKTFPLFLVLVLEAPTMNLLWHRGGRRVIWWEGREEKRKKKEEKGGGRDRRMSA